MSILHASGGIRLEGVAVFSDLPCPLDLGSPGHAAFRSFDERDELFHRFMIGGPIRLQGTQRGGEVAILPEEELLVGRFEGLDVVLGKAPALQADEVEPAGRGGVAVDDHERWNVLNHLGTAADDRVAADSAELVNGGEAGNDGMIFDFDVAAESAVVGENDVIAHLAVVRDVRVAQEKIVRANARGRVGMGAAMDGRVFAEHVAVPDLEISRLAFVLEILGLAADRSEGEKLVVLSYAGGTVEDDVGVKNAVIADLHSRADDAIRSDPDVRAEFRFGRDDGRRMNHGPNDERAGTGWRMFFAPGEWGSSVVPPGAHRLSGDGRDPPLRG